ncbi:sorbitol dehydrogenase-like [Carcharodon carcharias]|uniref:sorbitol dehydrogenase-like n=1 Tax=Carcharodon carcharias TaxID=13397 RepID=UPI001B7E057F|nr:sorbitol dehydrogenase-like [Carcharodon carcharias]
MSQQENQALVLACGELKLEKRPVPELCPGDVLLKMGFVGICSTDVHFWSEGKFADMCVKKPLVLGHEASGTVVKVSCGVNHLKAGDKVTIEPIVPRENDEYVRIGRYNLSPTSFQAGFPNDDGAMCRFYVHKANYCYKLPECVSLEEGALVEPLCVAIHACQRGRVKVGQKVFICGAGPIGLLTLLVCKAIGVTMTVVCDMCQDRLEKAKCFGATIVLKVDKCTCPMELAQKVKNSLCAMPDICLECTGSDTCVQAGVYAVKPGGIVVLVGMGLVTANIPVTQATMREVDIRGSYRYTNTWHTAIALIASKKVDVKSLITSRFGLEQAQEGFECVKKGAGIKVLLNCEQQQQQCPSLCPQQQCVQQQSQCQTRQCPQHSFF